MNRIKQIIIAAIAAGILASASFQSAHCQNQNGEESVPQQPTDKNQTIVALDIIYQTILQAKQQLTEKGEELKSDLNEDHKQTLISDIKQLKEKISFLEKDFERIASGVELDQFYAKPKADFDWQKEMQELLNPVVQELKNMTEKPRQIEKLKREISVYESRIPVLAKAIANIDVLLSETTKPELKKYLDEVKARLTEKKQFNENQYRIVKYQLDEKDKDKKSIFETAQTILKSFFKTRGRNLIISLLSFAAVFLLLRYIGKQLMKTSVLKNREKSSHYFRALQIGYQFATVLGAIGASMIVLYFSGDWFLLSIIIIFLLGIAWTARQGFSRFWGVIKLMLNLGSVRENERIIYKGLPWKVTALNLYSVIENPAFQTGSLKVPIEELMNLISRPCDDHEPWFPCRINDWVILADETYGKISVLTPETVQIVLLGGSIKSYQTQDFLSQNPVNLSTSFRISASFGIDYKHQPICTTEVPEKLKNLIHERLNQEGYAEHLKNINVEFKSAAASSLDYSVLADFKGSAADSYKKLERFIQKVCVDACNEYGWTIPFTQITIHDARKNQKSYSES